MIKVTSFIGCQLLFSASFSLSLFCYCRKAPFSCSFEYFIMKNKWDQHKDSLVTNAEWKKNEVVLLWLTVIEIIRETELFCRGIYIAKYIMNSTSWWRNIIWIVTSFPIYLSVKWRFCRQFTEKTYHCSETKHIKLEKSSNCFYFLSVKWLRVIASHCIR
jgi:hypothetical protein